MGPLAVTGLILVGSCFDDPISSPVHIGQFALAPSFDNNSAVLVEIDRLHLTLRRVSDNSIALDTTVTIAAASDSVDLSFRVGMFTQTDKFELTLQLFSPSDELVFEGGPLTVTPSTGGGDQVPPIDIPLAYVGVGANAAGVRFVTTAAQVFFGGTVGVVAEAFGADGAAIPGTPIAFSSLDPNRASVPDPAAGQVLGGSERGDARIVATLLTGPADTTTVKVQPTPSAVAVVSGNDQSGDVGGTLAQPIVVEVAGADQLPVEGVAIAFASAEGGTFSPASAVTGVDGRASTSWTLGPTAGTQTGSATVEAFPSVQASFAANAAPAAATQLVFAQQPTSATQGTVVSPPVTVEVRDVNGNLVTSATNSVTLTIGTNPGGGILGGTVTVAAVAGVATFADLSIDLPGSGYTLVASSGTLTQATSAAFDIFGPRRVSWVGTVSGNWSDGTKWSTGMPPAPVDSAVIQQPGTYTVTLDVDATVADLRIGASTGIQTLITTSRTLTITGTSMHVDLNGVFEVAGGTLTGAGFVGVTGTLKWIAGTMSGSGITRIEPGGSLVLGVPASLTVTLTQRTLEVAGTLTWSGTGNLTLSSGAALTVLGTGVVDMQSDAALVNGGGTPAPTVSNAGTWRKSGGAGSAVIGLPFSNTGTVDVASGTLDVSQGYTHGPAAIAQGAGTLNIGANSLSVTGTVSVGNLMIGGLLSSGGGTFSIGTVVFTGTGPQTIPAVFSYQNVTVTGTAQFELATISIVGNLAIAGSGIAEVGDASVSVGGGLSTEGSGALSMTGRSGSLGVTGGAAFNGGSTEGKLLNGTLAVGGTFKQSGNALSFASTGTVVTFNGSAVQAVSFASPGLASSRLASVNVSGAGLDFVTDVAISGVLTIGGFLGGAVTGVGVTAFVGGGVDNFGGEGGSWLVDNTVFTAPPSVVPNSAKNVTFQAGALLPSFFSVSGNLDVTGGDLNLGTNTVLVGGNFSTSGAATLTMDNVSFPPTLDVEGHVTFGGGSTFNRLLTGTIRVAGNFIQSGDAESFHADNLHTIVFDGTAQTISFATPGIGAGVTASHFAHLEFNTSGSITLNSDIFAHSDLTVGSLVIPTVIGNGNRMAVGGVNVNGLTLERVLFEWNGTTGFPSFGTFAAFTNVTFNKYLPGDVPLTVIDEGTAATIDYAMPALTFTTTPDGITGFYIRATDSDGGIDVLEIDVSTSLTVPACNAKLFQPLNGAIIVSNCP